MRTPLCDRNGGSPIRISKCILERCTSQHFGGPGTTESISGAGGINRVHLCSGEGGFNELQHDRFIDFLTERTVPFSFPVVANMDFGHTTPMITMPLGLQVSIDGARQTVSIDESFAKALI